MNGWTKYDIYTYHNTVFRLKQILALPTSHMNLEDIIISIMSQSQNNKYPMIPLVWGTEGSHIYRDRKKNGAGGGESTH